MPPPSPPATTTEKPGSPPSATTSTPPNIPKVEEKKDPNDGDIILSSKSNDKNTEVATKVDKMSKTPKMDFNRGYVMGFTAALDPGLSKVFKIHMSLDSTIFKKLSRGVSKWI